MQPKAFIFDLDGVLTSTDKYHFLAWKKLADRLGLDFTETVNEKLKGVDRLTSLEIILAHNGVSDKFSDAEKAALANEKNEHYKTLILKMTKADILPGIEDFLAVLREKGIKTGVASVSKNAETVLSVLNIKDRFDYVADAAKVTKPKPDPEIFALCASELGFEGNDCVGVEDAQSGIEAITAAGMFSVGIGVEVTSVRPRLELGSTAELDFEKICEAYTAWRNSQ